MNSKKHWVLITVALTLFAGCSSTPIENQNPVGQLFPSVSGTTLEKDEVELPDLFVGEKTVLLLGYKQNSQFDIDRWLIGLDMTQTAVKAYELPTIKGLAPRFFKGYIDDGMRAGIPKELWGGVITIYEDGAKIQSFRFPPGAGQCIRTPAQFLWPQFYQHISAASF